MITSNPAAMRPEDAATYLALSTQRLAKMRLSALPAPTTCAPSISRGSLSPDKVTFLKARVGGTEGRIMAFSGRSAWALAHLIAVGPTGLTTIERPAPRWSHYLWLLRRAGLEIDRQDEAHGGAYSGHHGRYRLRSIVEVLEVREAA